jgi:poly(A) polymerase
MQKHQPPTIFSRDAHCISRSNISASALKVLYQLNKAGYEAYLVGGSVRDLLLGKQPKDFDIATNAHPEQIKQIFRNCLLIGRRFRLAHIRFGREIIEVATFRADHSKALGDEGRSIDGLIVRDNVYGSLEEDAWRRDFTVNSLYYNIADFSVIDYCNGMYDLEKRQICIIGDPIQRYQEDPVRLLRAIRFAAQLDFKIEENTSSPIYEMNYLLHQISPARLFEEVLKLFLKGHALNTFHLASHYQIFKALFPSTAHCIQHPKQYPIQQLIENAMRNSDERIAQGKTITPAFILAVLLWFPLLQEIEFEKQEFLPDGIAIDNAIRKILRKQQQITTIPRRFTVSMEEIWRLQFRFYKRSRRNAFKIISHPRFRAAYDFLLLRAEADEDLTSLADWWTQFYEGNENTRKQLLTRSGK